VRNTATVALAAYLTDHGLDGATATTITATALPRGRRRPLTGSCHLTKEKPALSERTLRLLSPEKRSCPMSINVRKPWVCDADDVNKNTMRNQQITVASAESWPVALDS
jgi:hypothetical protein